MELLAPAGSLSLLKTAIDSGADGVYFGLKNFNARRNAPNFDLDELCEGVLYAHKYGGKAYVTLNTLVKETELNEAFETLRQIYLSGADAVIIQDLGLIELIKNHFRPLKIHASTQMTIHNADGANLLLKQGVSRVVLARELSSENLRTIKQNSAIELEVFVHGALCVCYSGQCLMSSFIGGRSANRGVCAQPCRLPYKIGNKEGYFLSLKDLSLIEHIDTLKKIGVHSLKIEGRLKGENYISAVTSIYRKCIDGQKISQQDIRILETVFDRGGYTDKYFTGTKKDMFTIQKNENPHHLADGIKLELPKRAILKNKPLRFSVTLKQDEPLVMTVSSGQEKVVFTSEKKAVKALNQPLTANRMTQQIDKFSDTPFYLEQIDFDIEDNTMISISEINLLRRKAIEYFSENNQREDVPLITFPIHQRKAHDFMLDIEVSDYQQYLFAAEKKDIRYIFAPVLMFDDAHPVKTKNTVAVLPRIIKDRDIDIVKKACAPFDKISVSNAGQLEFVQNKTLFTSPYINAYNSLSCAKYQSLGVTEVTISPELNNSEIKKIDEKIPLSMIIYGHLTSMICDNRIIKNAIGSCSGNAVIKDRHNESFSVRCASKPCDICELLNPHPLSFLDKKDDLNALGLSAVRILFTTENTLECEQIYKCYHENKNPPTKNITRGGFYRRTI